MDQRLFEDLIKRLDRIEILLKRERGPRLRTFKEAAEETGRTERYFRYLVEKKALEVYRVFDAPHISMEDFEKLAVKQTSKSSRNSP